MRVSVEEPKRGIEAARITHAKVGNGTINDIMDWVRSLPDLDPDDNSLWEAIAEDRAMRRQLTKEREE